MRQLVLPGRNSYRILELVDIAYLEANGNYVLVHLCDGKQRMATQTLNHFETLLEAEGFFRIHKSYLVNCAKVTHYEGGRGGHAFLTGDIGLPIAFRRKTAFTKKMKKVEASS